MLLSAVLLIVLIVLVRGSGRIVSVALTGIVVIVVLILAVLAGVVVIALAGILSILLFVIIHYAYLL